MVTARIRDGRIEADEPIPDSWEGMKVLVQPLSVETDPDDLETRLRALHELGMTEFEDGEVERIQQALSEMDRRSRDEMTRLMRDASP